MGEGWDDATPGKAAFDGFLIGVAGVILALAAGLGVLRYVGGSPATRGVEGVLACVALAVIVAAPGLLTLMARAGRPSLLVAAGTVLVPLSLLSFAGVTLPLLVPAVLVLVASGRRAAGLPPPRAPAAITTVAVLVLLLAAVLALLVHQDPRSWQTSTASGSTSDVITYGESLLALDLVAAALVLGRWLASPAEARRADPGPLSAGRGGSRAATAWPPGAPRRRRRGRPGARRS